MILIGLANSEHSHPSGLLLKIRMLLQYMPDSERLASSECVWDRESIVCQSPSHST